jgi:hypothetical protein
VISWRATRTTPTAGGPSWATTGGEPQTTKQAKIAAASTTLFMTVPDPTVHRFR